jgi:prepilin-type N-terminal cleavage/methylation domain-containing protein
MNSFRRYKTGFTLIEVIVVIAIIGLLSSIILVAVNKVRDSGRLAGAKKFATYTYRGFGADALGIWTFDDTTNLAKDTSQYNNAGYNTVPCVNGVCGSGISSSNITYNNQGRSVLFDGTTGYICSDSSVLTVSTGTIGAWIKTNDSETADYNTIVSRESKYYLGFNPSNELIVWNWSPAGAITTGRKINDGNWHYVAFSFKSGVTNGSSIYIDGNLINTFTYTQTNTASPFSIGRNAQINAQNFIGNIDDVVLYSQPLLASEIYDLYASQAPKYGIALSP